MGVRPDRAFVIVSVVTMTLMFVSRDRHYESVPR
jgi:hypothetical protein